MLRRITGLVAAAACVVATFVIGTTVEAAAAGDSCGQATCPDDPDTPSTDGGTVTVTVTSTFVKKGSSGSGGTSTATVKVSPPCIYFDAWTGKEYFKLIDSGQAESAWNHIYRDNPRPFKPNPGWKDHKDDKKGSWYESMCSSADFDGPLDKFFDFAEDWFDTHDGVWVDQGDTPPVPEIPPEILLEAAQKSMTLPEPKFDWNPKANGGSTLVNLDTWLWLDDPVDSGTITASAGNSRVTVDAKRDKVTFSASSAGNVACQDGGTEWTHGASSDCVLHFRRAGSTPVTATANWDLSWSANGEDQGALDPITATQTAPIDVIEVQNIVTDIG